MRTRGILLGGWRALNRRIGNIAAKDIEDNDIRSYNYYIDTRGWVFFEEEEYRTAATSIRDQKFLVGLFTLTNRKCCSGI